ncbi:MAG: hypothetical protein IPO22_22355 [Anaerolineales bacterium]|nr:hypothetical protein [Anaerolineales bacterium]
MTLEVEVQPEGVLNLINLSRLVASQRNLVSGVMISGSKNLGDVRPNDTTQMMFEYYDEDRKHILGRPLFEKLEKRNNDIRKTGEEALAGILEIEDLQVTNLIERDHLQAILRLKLVTPRQASHFKQKRKIFMNAGLHKYAVGKKVYVKFNPQDKTQVAIERSD